MMLFVIIGDADEFGKLFLQKNFTQTIEIIRKRISRDGMGENKTPLFPDWEKHDIIQKIKEGKHMNEDRVIISVLGRDRTGIIATITGVLARHGGNILDISQTILQEYFTMIMLVDLSGCDLDFPRLKEELEKAGEEVGMQVNIQHTDVFDYMHRI